MNSPILADVKLINYIPQEWIVFLLILAFMAVYMLPTWIAGFTKHPDTVGIAVVNAVFGWSGIGFLLCLIWAFRKPQTSSQQIVQHITPPPISQPIPTPSKSSLEDQLFVLESLKERKLISASEYDVRRRKLLETI
ncbi:MAG: superinfection immunity protein [Luteolibacter sp.]